TSHHAPISLRSFVDHCRDRHQIRFHTSPDENHSFRRHHATSISWEGSARSFVRTTPRDQLPAALTMTRARRSSAKRVPRCERPSPRVCFIRSPYRSAFEMPKVLLCHVVSAEHRGNARVCGLKCDQDLNGRSVRWHHKRSL